MENYKILTFLLFLSTSEAITNTYYTRTTSFDLMKCSYGERGSLTATCVNATTGYFKNTQYRFDHLDETLRCVNCSLQNLESGSFDISGNQIKNLDLSNSLIGTIKQKAFVGLIFLERLSLANNDIKSIYPGTFSGVKKIISVDLENNSIGILSEDGFQELVSLQSLNLRNNHIKIIAFGAFNGLVKLKELDLSHNEIGSFKHVFDNLTALEVLDLSNNKILALTGDDFNNQTSFALLDIRLNYNHINSIPALEFFSMGVLRRLDLSYNVIDRLIAGSFKGLYALEDLDLSFNNIAEVPQKTLQSLRNLQHLNISNNWLSNFQTGLYSGLPQLRMLNFSHNFIEDIQITGVFSLDSLDTLDFSRNNISYIDYVPLISRLPKISYLNLEDNILPCGLEKEMENYFAEDNFKFVLYRNEVGVVKCVDNPSAVIKHHKDNIIGEAAYGGGSTATTVWIFVLITFTLIFVAVLYYLQYRTFQIIRSVAIKRATSQVPLIVSSDLEARDNEYLKE